MRKRILAANWKMNLTQTQVDSWLAAFQSKNWSSVSAEVRVYPSAVYLKDFQDFRIHQGAQNVYYKERGAYTGELSIEQLQSVGCASVLLGHSERREFFQESNELIAQKVEACVQAAFPFILCCGEPLDVRQAQNHKAFVLDQIRKNLEHLTPSQLDLLVIAYEPIWAIGSGLSASVQEISEMHLAIRTFLNDQFAEAGQNVPILYGGSVNAANAGAIFACANVDGALVGGASLDPDTFYQLWLALCA